MLRALERVRTGGKLAEERLAAAALLAMGLLPAAEVFLRALLQVGIPGSTGYVQHLTLWVGFLGAMLASREQRHLSLASGLISLPPRAQVVGSAIVTGTSAAVASGLFWASLEFVRAELGSPSRIAGWLPVWVVESVLPVAFAVVVVRCVTHAGGRGPRAVALLGILLAAALGCVPASQASRLFWPGIAGLVGSALLGAPVFVVLGGMALLLFLTDGVAVAAIPVETYRMIISPSIPTIPLFTLTGFILAEGGASRRLVRLFRALIGWMPGGLAVATTLVCAFFTTFTGASGITILALGGLLLPVLLQGGYRERFSIGLLTATGSLGLLLPPSLPVILYGVVAHVPIPSLFKAGVVPGLLMVAVVALFGVRQGLRSLVPRAEFDMREAAAALWEAKWEILLPVVALGAIFGGFCTLNEAAAITVVYGLIVATLVQRELHVARDLLRILVSCATLIGGVFIILGVAMGLTNYLVDAQVPMKAAAWVQATVHSRALFLVALNIFLLAVGCLMEIFSAIVVVVPLILPMSEVFGIHPVHLGMIFLANLELGYLTPPVGMNLFLASYRFERPLGEVWRHAVPFFMLLLGVVLLVTYVPLLTVWGVE